MDFEQYPESAIRPAASGTNTKPSSLVDEFPQFKPVSSNQPVVKPILPSGVQPDIQMSAVPDMQVQTPVAEESAISVALPSKFVFYPFQDLFVGSPKARHLAKFAKAHAERSLRITVEVISSLLSTTSPDMNGKSLAHMLTVPDFYFVMYFLRLNNYNKTQFTHKSRCRNPKHLKRVEEGELAAETLEIQELITGSRLETQDLTEIPTVDPSLLNGLKVKPAFMRDSIEWLEHPRIADPEVQFLGQLAMYVDGSHLPKDTMDARMLLVDNLDPDQIQLIRDYDRAMMAYGITEKINVRCKECGASMETTVNIDAHSFLPN